MKYDFTTVMDRHEKDAIAVDAVGTGGFAPGAPQEGFDVIPMWVADMNFPMAPSIQEAVIQRMRTRHLATFLSLTNISIRSSAGRGNATALIF